MHIFEYSFYSQKKPLDSEILDKIHNLRVGRFEDYEIYKIDNNLQIYIHTWNIFSNNISWRKIEADNKIVTKEIIEDYFNILSRLIKHIIIDDDRIQMCDWDNLGLNPKTEIQ